MKNNVLKYVMFVGGILLLGSILCLLRDQFPSPPIFALDSVVIGIIYLFFFFSFGGIFSSSTHFGNKVASIGLWMITDMVYSLLAVVGVVVGCMIPIAVEWQCLYQGLFLFLAITGLYVASTAKMRENAIHQQSTTPDESIGALRSEIEQLRIRVNTSPVADSFQKDQIKTLEGRMKYLSFNPSSAARALEIELSGEFNRMLSLLPSLPGSSTEWSASFARCEALLTARIRMVVHPN